MILPDGDLLRGSYVDVKAGRVTFGEYAARCSSTRQVNPSTVERERIVMRVSLLPVFGFASHR